MKNKEDYLVATAASRLLSLELHFKYLVPKNLTNWKFFYDDAQNIQFLTDKDTYKDVVIDDEKHEK